MDVGDLLKTQSSNDCDCCHLPSDTPENGLGCSDRRLVFTPREHEIFARIRDIGERARSLKLELKQASKHGLMMHVAVERAESELAELRRIRAKLEEERISAAEERMRLLGHV